ATLTYVDTSGKLLSKEARAGTTTIAVGKAVKQTVDTRFYPRVHVCVSNLSASGYIVPGQTEVQICDGSNHAVPNGSGYTVTRPGLSSAGCTKRGGGVCPPDSAGLKADFTGLTGDDIAQLVFRPQQYDIADTIANVTYKSGGPGGTLVYYGELASHFPYAPLGGQYGNDIFHTADAKAFCGNAPGEIQGYKKSMFTETMKSGTTAGGAAKVSTVKSLFIGRIADAIKTGGDTNPELFVSGGGIAQAQITPVYYTSAEVNDSGVHGAAFPHVLVMVNGSRSAATAWSTLDDQPDAATYGNPPSSALYVQIGQKIADDTGWNLTDMYYVNNWPGTPLTLHKPDRNDMTNMYVTQVNYVSGYVCEALLQ
ncbi:hypothetical protein HU47_27260, partial [Salmonella enterica subsp. enterica serovar Abaetetuba]|nr:hypothetical protein [Salmonella enterica subsp. enterica serovar Abaetetuba]